MSLDLFDLASGNNIADLIASFHKILALIDVKLNITVAFDHLLIFSLSRSWFITPIITNHIKRLFHVSGAWG